MDLIIDGGKYGCQAIDYLKLKNRNFLLVDINPNCEATKSFKLETAFQLGAKGEFFLQGDLARAIEFIEETKPEYVFPTAPVHIVAEMERQNSK